MFQFEANEAFIVEQKKAIEAALSTNPKTQQVLRKIIRKYILEARAQVVSGIKFKNDPRGAANAVRSTVYKRVLGGNLNIYSSRKAHGSNGYEPPRRLRAGQRGGNRVKRGRETQRMMSYAGADRGMVLRWQNTGTADRMAGTRGGALHGNRGSIQGRHFFGSLGDRALGRMAATLSSVIESELVRLLPSDK